MFFKNNICKSVYNDKILILVFFLWIVIILDLGVILVVLEIIVKIDYKFIRLFLE